MNSDLPNTTGYPLEDARNMLEEAGCEAIEVSRVGRDDDAGGEKRSMVIRQRSVAESGVELTVALEWRTPMRSE